MEVGTLPATWQDAFQNQSVSSIRAAEKQLRAGVLRDREKLRALVGNNYRELLSTAEKIVTLADQTRTAESSISDLSQACKPRNIESQILAPPADTTSAAQLKFLDSTLRSALKAVKARSLVLASKLLILSRLLLKHLESTNIGTRTTQWLQNRLKATRQQLMQAIDFVLIQPTTTTKSLAQTIVAYCLITSSPSTDALKHFQNVRAQRIAQSLPPDKSGKAARQVLQAKCHYLIATVAALKALSGRIVNELLNDIQKKPIVEGDDITALETLQLDLYQPLLPSDVVTFTPYFKRATFTSSELRTNAQDWVNGSFDSIAADLESLITRMRLPVVLSIRYEILDIILPSCFSAFLHQSALDKLRAVFNTRVIQLVEEQARAVGVVAEKALEAQSVSVQEIFWESRVAQPDKTRSTNDYINRLRKSHLGIHNDLLFSIRGLQKWANGCDTVKRELLDIGKTRWRDKLEDFDEEDEDEAQSLINDLSKTDPEQYSAKFLTALREACDRSVQQFVVLANKTTADMSTGSETSSIISSLRLGREFNIILSTIVSGYDTTDLNEAITNLQNSLAERTTADLFAMLESVEPTDSKKFSTEDLPSPTAVCALRNLASVMLKNGGIDLWTPYVSTEIRRLVFERATSTENRKYYINSDFDMCYITAALGQRAPEISESSGKDAVNAKAVAYWKRTRILFGIFAPP